MRETFPRPVMWVPPPLPAPPRPRPAPCPARLARHATPIMAQPSQVVSAFLAQHSQLSIIVIILLSLCLHFAIYGRSTKKARLKIWRGARAGGAFFVCFCLFFVRFFTFFYVFHLFFWLS